MQGQICNLEQHGSGDAGGGNGGGIEVGGVDGKENEYSKT